MCPHIGQKVRKTLTKKENDLDNKFYFVKDHGKLATKNCNNVITWSDH